MNENIKRTLIIGGAVAAIGYFAFSVWSNFRVEGGSAYKYRTLQDINSGENYRVKLTTEDYGPYPHENPDTGEQTLYPTEVCYRNDCAEKGGTRVILNVWREDQKGEQTVCPACGYQVRIHNPRPPGYKSPD